MQITKKAMTAAAGVTAAALLALGAPAATAATVPCPGTGPAASLSAAQHDAFAAKMTALTAERDAIRATYGKAAPGKAGSKARARATKRLTAAQRTAMRAELAAWRVKRDALFAQYGLTARVGSGPRA